MVERLIGKKVEGVVCGLMEVLLRDLREGELRRTCVRMSDIPAQILTEYEPGMFR
jgi:hypothetical protein